MVFEAGRRSYNFQSGMSDVLKQRKDLFDLGVSHVSAE